MRTSLRSNLLNITLFGSFFAVLSLLAFFVTQKTLPQFLLLGGITGPYLDLLKTSASAIGKGFGPRDVATYVNFANYFLIHHNFEEWVINLWPPGQFFLLAFLFKTTGMSYYVLKMIFLSVVLWAVVLVFVFRSFDCIKNVFLRFLLTLAPFYFSPTLYFIFGEGSFGSELVCMPLFVLLICLYIRWLRTSRNVYLIFMAVIFAIMAYFRGYFELFANFLIELLTLMLLILIVRDYFLNKHLTPLKKWAKQMVLLKSSFFTNKKKAIIVSAMVFILLLLPWRFYLHHHRWQGSYAWQGLSNWTAFWTPDAQTTWLGSNVACKIKPKLCDILYQNDIIKPPAWAIDQEFYRNITLATFLFHPLKWYKIKLSNFDSFWYEGAIYSNPPNNSGVYAYFFEDSLILILGLLVVLLNFFIAWRCASQEAGGFALFGLTFLIYNFVIFTFFHFEPRYSIFLKLFFIYYPLWLFFGLPEVNNYAKTWLNKKFIAIK